MSIPVPIRQHTNDGAGHPLYVRLRTPSAYYIYDTYSNEILEVSRTVWDILDDYLSAAPLAHGHHTAEELTAAVQDIETGRANGYLGPCAPQQMQFYDGTSEALTHNIQSRISQLSLEVTEACNFRCLYCKYTYTHARTHAPVRMAPQTAFNAVAEFFSHSSGTDRRAITFWGGEPLLNFALIRQVVAHVAAHYTAPVRYGFTTNGSLLTGTVSEFLISHAFDLTVSLDGPPHIHDGHRVDARGRGTSATVLANLRQLLARNEEYYRAHVSFNCVVTPKTQYAALLGFFSSDDLFKGNTIKLGRVSGEGTPFFEQCGPYSAAQEAYLHEAYLEAVTRGEESAVVRAMFDPMMLLLARRCRHSLGATVPLNGCCVPLLKRMHVAVDGSIHVCEKIKRSSPLGNVNTSGIEHEKAVGLVSLYAHNSLPDCKDCWAVRLCTACYRDFVDDHQWCRSATARKACCDNIRTAVLARLQQYAAIMETNASAFDQLKRARLAQPV